MTVVIVSVTMLVKMTVVTVMVAMLVKMTVVYATVVTLIKIVMVTVSALLQMIVAANVLVVTPVMMLTVI